MKLLFRCLFGLLLFSQILGTIVPRPDRNTVISSICLAGETMAGMGGGYGFFTPANYWYGQSVGVEIIEHSRSEVVESPYQEILSPPGKIRFMNWSILWSYFYQKPDELNRIADGLAAYYLEKNPSTGSFSLRFYYRSESGKKFLKKPVYVKEYN